MYRQWASDVCCPLPLILFRWTADIKGPLLNVELDSWSSRLTGTIADDDTQNPAVDQEKAKRGKPKPRIERANAQELELISLLQPSSLRNNPEQQSRDAEFPISQEGRIGEVDWQENHIPQEVLIILVSKRKSVK